MRKQLSLRRVVGSIAAAVLAAAAAWLLCRWVGYDLQLRVGNQPVYEIVNDDYTRVIDLPEEGFDQAIPLQAGESLYGVRLRFSTHGQLYRAGMVMVDLCDAAGNELRQAAGNYANVFDDNFTGFSFGAPYTAERAETVYLHIYNAVEWEGPLGLWASETAVKDLPLTADGKSQNATLALQYIFYKYMHSSFTSFTKPHLRCFPLLRSSFLLIRRRSLQRFSQTDFHANLKSACINLCVNCDV